MGCSTVSTVEDAKLEEKGELPSEVVSLGVMRLKRQNQSNIEANMV